MFTFWKNRVIIKSEIQSGMQIISKTCENSGKMLVFQAFQKSGLKPVARATFYTVLLKGGFSLDFQAFSQFDNTGYKICYFSGIIELHNKKG